MPAVETAFPAPRRRNKRLVFICYRRSDSTEISGRLYDWLVPAFGSRNVIKDVISCPLGIPFKDYIGDCIPDCRFVLAIIGPDWLDRITAPKRAHQEEDLVRFELREALARNIPVVPVLIGGAKIPRLKDLPKDLRGVTKRQAIQLRSDPDFRGDAARLIKHLKRL